MDDLEARGRGIVVASHIRATVSDAIAVACAEAGVERAFGLPGDDTLLLVDALISHGVAYDVARHENAAVAMATGYASATGRLGLCIISRGPGTTNALTAAVNASRGDAAVMIVTGGEMLDAPVNGADLPDHKAVNAAAVAAALGIECYAPSSSDSIREVVRDAMSAALRRRTVLLAVPRDLLEADVPDAPSLPPARPARVPQTAAAEAIRTVVAVLENSRRPLIIAGAGAWSSGATETLTKLGDRLGAVLATSLRAKDMFDGSPYNIGIVGSISHSAARRLIDEADCVIAFGASLNRWTTTKGKGLPAVPIIQVDMERSRIGRYHRADIALVGDARLVAEQLHDALNERSDADKPWHTPATRETLASFDVAQDHESEATSLAMDPRDLVLELDALLPPDRTVVTDNGNFFGFIPAHISVPSPAHFKLSSDFAVIGLGLGTALGVAAARPSMRTVLFVGDGALLMSLGELETLARLGLPLTIVVMNDSSYGAEQHFLELRGLPGAPVMFPSTDFADAASAFGIRSETVRELDQLRALGSQITNATGPLLLDCKLVSTVVAPYFPRAH